MDLSSSDSQVAWISAPWRGSARSTVPVPYFRKGFVLDGDLAQAELRISAFGIYEAEINGNRVGDEIFAPGWTDYHKRVQYQTYDVRDLLRPGENVLGALLGDGWYCGHVGWQDRQIYGSHPWLFASLAIVMRDGTIVNVQSDESWKTKSGPLLESDLLMGESYDARLELGDWSLPGYDDRDWWPVVCGQPHLASQMVPRTGPPVRRIQEIATNEIVESPDGAGRKALRIDFGQNFSGRARIKVRSVVGTTLRLRYAEILDAEGNLYIDNLRSARATDYYTCKGGDTETWEPRFTFHGFRYMDVTGLFDEDLFEIVGIVLHSDISQTGFFRCSSPLLNQLQSNILWGQKSNFLEVPTDCPQRDERLGWTGDAQVFARTAAFNMNVQHFFRKWMQDVRDAQHPNGAIPLVAPMPGFLRHVPYEDGGPAWSDAVIICPWSIYLCYGDQGILEENYDAMKSYMEFMLTHRSVGYIRSHPNVDDWGGFGDWLALDGSGKLDGNTPKDLIGTAFFAYDTEIMVQVARLLGKEADAHEMSLQHSHIVASFRRRFITDEGLIAGGTQTAYTLALYFELVPVNLQANCARELVRLIERNQFHLATGFVGTPYLLDVLQKHGYLDTAYRLLEQESFPSWLFSVKNGATTIWERWNGWTPESGMQDKSMNSFNHYAYGAVGAWMYQTVAGLNLDASEPGYRHIIFRPRPGGSITWAEAALETVFGKVSIHWKLQDDALAVTLEIPQGTHAILQPPPDYNLEDQVVAPGTRHIILSRRHAQRIQQTQCVSLLETALDS